LADEAKLAVAEQQVRDAERIVARAIARLSVQGLQAIEAE
jgi:hypothetical protein